jgi:CHAD domain-containing protein
MNRGTLFRRWKRQQGRLLMALGKVMGRVRRRGEAEDIHELRVVVRRLRQLVRLGAGWYGRKTAVEFRDWSRLVASATDRTRDMDVTLEWLATEVHAEGWVERVRRLRAGCYRQAKARLVALPKGMAEALSAPPGGRRHEVRLERRLKRLQAKLEERLRRSAPHFFRLSGEEQHDFRRVVRRWRYLRELASPKPKLGRDRLLRWLLGLQGVLGERQNLQLAQATLMRFRGVRGVDGMRRRLLGEIKRCERRIRKELGWLKGWS